MVMPLNKKGKKILKNMQTTYTPKKAKQVFNAMVNEGKITDVESKKTSKKKK